MEGAASKFVLLLVVIAVSVVECRTKYQCPGSPDAISALRSDANVTVTSLPGIGYSFLGLTDVAPPYLGGSNVTRGIVIIPEDGVAPEAYAPLAREVASSGRYVVILEKASEGRTLRAMKEKWQLKFWVFVGHGRGGALAAELVRTLQPKVKVLVLLAAPMLRQVDMTDLNVFVSVLYGQKDALVTPKAVESSFSRLPEGDSLITLYPKLGHYDFASSVCVGNREEGKEKSRPGLLGADFENIANVVTYIVSLWAWAGATEKALSFLDNYNLTPGHNTSKTYPGNIRVQCTQVPIPNSNPVRSWWVFTPSKIKGGLVYYPGSVVDARAYSQLAFEIAARGHLVVIVQMPARMALVSYKDANTVIASTNPLFSGVPKGRWALAGHSAGAYAVTMYTFEFGDRVSAAALHSGGWATNMTDNPLPIASIYGTLDGVVTGGPERFRNPFTEPPPKGIGPLVNLATTKFVPVKGANHYQVGDYGYQPPDRVATISMEQQVTQFARETVAFLDDVASGMPASVPIRTEGIGGDGRSHSKLVQGNRGRGWRCSRSHSKLV